jgi:hypothetical protein
MAILVRPTYGRRPSNRLFPPERNIGASYRPSSELPASHRGELSQDISRGLGNWLLAFPA